MRAQSENILIGSAGAADFTPRGHKTDEYANLLLCPAMRAAAAAEHFLFSPQARTQPTKKMLNAPAHI